ncbi:MAG: beta strand repeat-containing protein, partial [Bdellovibrionales bacterium]
PTLTVTPGAVSLAQSEVSVSNSTLLSGANITVTLTARDANGNNLTSGGLTVAFNRSGGTSNGTFSSVTDNSNGSYTATFTGSTSGTATTLGATIGGSAVTSTLPTVTVNPGAFNLANSIVTVGSGTVVSGNSTTLTLTVRDAANNALTTGGLTIAFNRSGGTSTGSIGAVTDNGNGTYSASFTGVVAGTATNIGATIGGAAVISTSPTITVIPGAVSLANSSVTLSNSTVASGSTVTATLQARDSNNNNLTAGGLTVVFGRSGGTSTGSFAPTSDNLDGTYSGVFTGALSGTATDITATIGGAAITSLPPQLTVTPGPANLSQSLITVSSATITSGASTLVTLTARDANGNNLTSGGLAVVFARTGGTSTGTFSAVSDNSNGTYTANFTGVVAGTATTITGTIGGSAVTSTLPTVTVNAGASTAANSLVTVNASSVSAGNTVTLTLTARDAANNPITTGGSTVTFSFSGGTSTGTIGTVTDNTNGTYTAVLTGNISGTPSTVSATIDAASVTSSLPTVQVNPGTVSVTQSLVSVSSSTVNSGSSISLTLQAKDAFGNNLTSGGLTVLFARSGGVSSGTFGTVTDNSNGTYSGTFTGTTAGSATTITATINGSPVTSVLPTVTVNPGPFNLAQSSVSLSSGSVISGSTVTGTLTVRDANNNQLTSGGLTVNFLRSGGVSNVSFGSVTDNANGTYTVTITGTTAGSATSIGANINGSSITSSFASLTVNPGAISVSQSFITVSQSTLASADISLLTLNARDANGNTITTGGQTVVFSRSGGTSNGNISATTDNGNGTYAANFVGTTAGSATTIN